MSKDEMAFLDHLEELRWRIIKSAISVVILTIAVFYFSDPIMQFLLEPALHTQAPVNLQVLKVQAIFIIKLEIALIVGIVLSIPVILYQLWAFVAPGLHQNERRFIWPVIVGSMFSFIAGAAFAFYLIIPFALEFFLGLAPSTVENNIAVDFYFGFLLRMLIVFGIVFQLPVVSVILSRLGLITPQFLRKYRRHAIVIFFIAAAILTPPDPTTQIMLAVPMILLYELTIGLSYLFYKKKEKARTLITETTHSPFADKQ